MLDVHIVAEILTAFAETGRVLSPERAEALGREIATYGGLDAAIAGLAHDDAFHGLADALAFRSALAERADPGALAVRLAREADLLDERVESALSEAAEYWGKAALRRRQGEHELARRFDDRATGAERQASNLADEALAKRLLAARTGARASFGVFLGELAA
jgi:hypothetical protein